MIGGLLLARFGRMDANESGRRGGSGTSLQAVFVVGYIMKTLRALSELFWHLCGKFCSSSGMLRFPAAGDMTLLRSLLCVIVMGRHVFHVVVFGE